MGSAAPAFQTRRPSYCSWCWLQQLLLHVEILMMEGMKLRRERQRQGIIHMVDMVEDMEGTVDMEGMVVVIMARDLLRLDMDMVDMEEVVVATVGMADIADMAVAMADIPVDMVEVTMAKDLLSLDMVVVMEEDMVVAMDPDMVEDMVGMVDMVDMVDTVEDMVEDTGADTNLT